MTEIDQNTLINAIISVSAVLTSIIITMLFWLRVALIRLFNEVIKNLKKDIDHCQDKINLRIDALDEYGQKNRQISFEARDKLGDHVERYHTK